METSGRQSVGYQSEHASVRGATGTQTGIRKKRAPTLYVIIVIKLLKGLLFVTLAITIYALADNDLPTELNHALHVLRFNPERKFWSDLAIQLGEISEKKRVLAAAGTLVYSLFSLVEAVGLMLRIKWIGWMTIAESMFFIPIEVYELLHGPPPESNRNAHPILVVIILAINIMIVWYLLKNRERIFRHHE
jgi:Predicted membrane protein